MNQKLTKKEQNVAKGSIYDVAESRGERPEDVLAEADVIVMLDESSSMMWDVGGGKSRHELATEALRSIQATFPGRVVLISFNSAARFHWNGLPSHPAGSTMIGLALDMASQFTDMGMRFYLISDGEPSDGDRAIHIARSVYKNEPINCIFIGEDSDLSGKEFLDRLAAASGGHASGKVDLDDLGEEVTKLLTGRKG